jgi:hypothetical protein
MRGIATAMRVASNKEDEGGNGDEDGDKGCGRATVMATKRAVAMAMRVAGEDADDGKGGKSNGDGTKRAITRTREMAGLIYKIK